MANFKRTYINADEELVIQGKLTIEGEMIQKEFVETSSFSQTNFDGDLLVVNADGWTQAATPVATNSELKLRSGNANASLLFNSIAGTLTLSASPAITTTLTVDGDVSATDITASGTITGNLTGTASLATNATTLANARNFSITGDVDAPAVSFNGGAPVVLNTTLDTVNSNVGTFGTATATPQITVNAKGLTTAVTNVNIAIPSSAVTDLEATVEGFFSATDAGGDGSLAYASGVITYTGPSAAEVRAHLGNAAPIGYNSGTGVISFSGTSDDVTEGSTNLYSTVANTRSALSAGTGMTFSGGAFSITNSGVTAASYGTASAVGTLAINAQGQITSASDTNIAITSSAVTDFSEAVDDRVNGLLVAGTGITKTYNDGANTYTLAITSAEVSHDNLSGFVANEHIDHSAVVLSGGTGITTSIGDITASRSISIDATVATLTGTQTLTNKTLTSPTISQIVGTLEVTGDLNIVGNMNSATQTDSFVTTKMLTLNVGGGATPDASRIEVDRTGTGSNTYIRWNETSDKWMFSNNGSANNNMLLLSDFSASSSGDGSLAYASGVFTYTGPSATEQRAHISVTDAGGDGSASYNASSGVITYTGPSAAEVRAHLSAGTGITYSGGAISVGTQPTILNFTQGHVKFDANSIGIGPSAGTFAVGEANSIAIGNTAGTTTQQSGAVAIGVEAGKTSQIDAGVALGWKAGWNNQGGRTIAGGNSGGTGSAVAIGTSAGYTNQGEHSVAIGSSAGLVQQQEHSIAIGRKAGNSGQSAYSIAIGVEAGETTQGDYSIAIGHKAGETSQAADSIVLRAGDSAFPYPAAATAGATYITPLRNTTADTGKVVMYNDSTYEVSRVPSTVFVQVSGNQTIAGTKTFSDGLIIPGSATATNGAIYIDNSATKAYVYVNGSAQEITPASSVGTVEDVGATGTNLYAGVRTAGSTTYHGVKSLAGGTGVTLAETGNVVTVTTDAFRSDSNVRALLSAVDSAGDGTFSYNNSTGAFTYSGISDAQVRGKISGTGLISYDSGTGVVSTTADNYSSFTVQTDTGGGGAEAISSGETLTFVGGTNTTVTNTGNTITIRNDNNADIEAVTAGTGMTGGGNAGSVTLNVIGGDGITANADDIALSSSVAGTGLTFTSGVVNVIGGDGITANANDIAIDYSDTWKGHIIPDTNAAYDIGNASYKIRHLYLSDTSLTLGNVALSSPADILKWNGENVAIAGETGHFTTAQIAEGTNKYYTDTRARTAISVSGDLAYNSSTGVISFTNDAGDIEGVTAGTGLTGGGTSGTVSLNVSGLTVAELAAGSLQLGTESFSDSDSILMTSAAIQDKILSYGYTTETGDVTGVTAGAGMTGGGSSGALTLNVIAGTGITVSADAVAVNMGAFDTADLTEGTNLYYTDTRARASNSGGSGITYNSTTGAISLTEDTVSYIAGTGLTGGGAASLGNVATINVVGGNGITANAHDIEIDLTDTAVFTSANTASKAVVRDASGNFSAGVITATATTARYADLAEKYHADADYDPGTVLIIGGPTEVTVTDQPGSYAVAGVVSTDPAYLMNAETTGVAVALRGRVPCKVIGTVNKGDVLITSGTPGFAMVAPDVTTLSPLQIIGRALSNKTDAGSGVIEIIV